MKIERWLYFGNRRNVVKTKGGKGFMRPKKRKRRFMKQIVAMLLCVGMLSGMFEGIPVMHEYMPMVEEVEAAENSYLWPVPYSRSMSRGYGGGHDALDITGAYNTPIVASKSGTVVKVLSGDEKNWVGYGNGVVISHGDGYYTHYAHMASVCVSQGQNVSQGQQIGGMGSTGNSTGVHLHFAIATSMYGGGGRINNNLNTIGYIYSVGNNPQGYIDEISGGAGQVTVSGWAFDRDNVGSTIRMDVYIGGGAGTPGVEIHHVYANVSRTDVNAHFSGGVGDNHGYYSNIQTNKTGNQPIYIYAINIGGGRDIELGHKTVNISPKITYKVHTGNATDITNTNAKISGYTSPAGTVGSWGFYIGTSESDMKKYTVSSRSVSSGDMTANVASYHTLKPGTKYYYKIWANVNGKEQMAASSSSFVTTSIKPEIPKLKISAADTDKGIGDTVTVSWSAVKDASHYLLYLYDEENRMVQMTSPITGTKYAFSDLKDAGEYSVYIEAYNEVGTKGKSEAVNFTIHENVTVTFVDASNFLDVGEDYTPEVLDVQTISYGHDASSPSNPSHEGYTFKEWSASFKGVKEDITVEAVYDINTYTVKYVDSTTNETLGTEKVEYYGAANPVDYEVPTGYAKTGYDGWDKDYTCIKGDTTLYTCVGWYNEDFPIYAEITEATREYDAAANDNEGYTIKVNLKNWDESTTKGRIVVALKTKEGKLLTSTESAAFSIKKSTEKEHEIFVPYDKAATIAEVYVIGQYKDAVPITTTASNNATFEINQEATYTDWSTELPPEGVENQQTKTEYRYSDKSTTTSYDTSLSGYTQSGSSWVQSGSGSVDYVSSFPAGFNTGSPYYSAYNKTPVTAYETATDKRTVSTSVAGYLYYHWCRGTYTSGPINRAVSDCWTSTYNTFHAYTSGALGYNSSAGAFQNSRADVCRDTYWWLATGCWSGNQLPIYKCNYTNYRKLFNYYKWSDFSDWSTTEYAETENRKVESRTLYRYQSDAMMEEDASGEERTISGSLGAEFAGKEAALFIYKVDEASDYTNEYVAQTLLDEEGNYSFAFKLREEPTAETGDMTVVLGVEGTSTAIYLDTIEAPKKEYTVNFYDYNGEVISTQTVTEGEAAVLPEDEAVEREGYRFVRWSDTNVNVTENRDIYAEYEIEKYNVVFVDWQANSVTVKEFDYGAQIVAPIAEEPEEGILVEWDLIADGVTTVTEDMVICTRYEKKNFDVKIKDADGNVTDTQQVEYGKAVVLPEVEEEKGRIFLGWKNVADNEEVALESTLITKNTILCPEYTFTEWVSNPTADVETGAYEKAQTVTLSCETEGASIYYTLDGSNPTEYNGILYTEPLTIDEAVTLKFYAAAIGMNDSDIMTNYYVVNYDGAKSPWMTYEELPEDVKENMDTYEVYTDTGYSYKDVKTTQLAAEASALEAAGWQYEENEEYSDYTEWLDEPLVDDGTYIHMDGETQPVYTEDYKYQYSHYVYTNGTATCYSAEEVEGYECTYETKEFDTALRASFDGNGDPMYVYDGQTWFNQTKVMGQVQCGTQYRYRYKEATYYKWTNYTLEAPTASETREYQEETVCTYIRHNNYLLNIYSDTGLLDTLILEEGSKFDILPYEYMEGHTYAGVYTDEDYTTEWDAENNTITENMNLYIKYTANPHTVTFIYEDGEEIDSQTVEYGNAATPPEVKEIEGYKFVGWDTEEYKSVQKDLTVTAKYVEESEYATVSLDNTSVTLHAGKSVELSAVIEPANHAGTELEWTSDNESIASVSDTGIVTGIGEGTAVITVKVKETGETATCKVKVKVNLDTTLSLLKNSKLSVDNYGYLRGVKAGANTIAEIAKEFENDSVVCKDKNDVELEESALLGTGCKVYLFSGTTIMDELEAIISAELTGDGRINNRDVSLLSRTLLDKEVPEDCQIFAGDVNGDGEVNNRDVSIIARYLVGKETL
ncbi:MAG: peptidoglycan DD-metalloendopeptidase family protein [Lachnospiraceae bacterium]|nr:peptidoglycan DD-metalloendopeptidase family protein [Lachnospiraceae bacterium]